MEDREYGPWIRAIPSNRNRRSVVRIPGFYEARKKTKAQASKEGVRAGAECIVEERED